MSKKSGHRALIKLPMEDLFFILDKSSRISRFFNSNLKYNLRPDRGYLSQWGTVSL